MSKLEQKKCDFSGCENFTQSSGNRYCAGHYKQRQRIGSMHELNYIGRNKQCVVSECGGGHSSRGLCRKHYSIMRKYKIADEDDRKCESPGCRLVHCAKGLCHIHYFIAKESTLAENLRALSDAYQISKGKKVANV